MMIFSVVDLIWIIVTFILGTSGFLIIFYENKLNRSFVSWYKYGKFNGSSRITSSWFHVPKNWFTHFYLFGILAYLILIFAVVEVYFHHRKIPSNIRLKLDSIIGNDRKSSVTPETIMICVLLMIAQVTRRFYECLFICVSSPDAKMNMIHYIFGLSFYLGIGISIISEAPGFKLGHDFHYYLSFGHVATTHHVLGVLLYILASVLQHQSHKILSSIRMDDRGYVVSYKYSIPKGGLFEYVSSPNYFCEILIYFSISGLIFNFESVTFMLIFILVLMTQVITGIFNHEWYHQKFRDDYPKSRRAVIPFIL